LANSGKVDDVRSKAIDPDALDALAARRGIDSVPELAERAGVPAGAIYKARIRGTLRPSYVTRLVELLGSDDFVREEVPAS